MQKIEITDHAYDRIKERMGLNKKAANRIVPVAYRDGIQHSETTGTLYRYIGSLTRSYMKKGACFKIYGENVFCFVNQKDRESGEKIGILLTVWIIPKDYRKQVLGLQRKKKEERRKELLIYSKVYDVIKSI